jgi:ribose transport system substrate-binding protein
MYVRQGILSASFEYPTGGGEAVEAALKILNGGQVAKEITLTSRVFTKENVETGGERLGE